MPIIRPGYQASSLGRVRGPRKLLQPATYTSGYLYFGFVENGGRRTTIGVHRAVCAAFHGMPPFEGAVARHLDGNQKNNVPSNLAWGSVQDNSNDAVSHGRSCKGERNGQARLTAEDVRAIRSRLASGEMGKDIAADFGVDPGTIYAIANRRTWVHV